MTAEVPWYDELVLATQTEPIFFSLMFYGWPYAMQPRWVSLFREHITETIQGRVLLRYIERGLRDREDLVILMTMIGVQPNTPEGYRATQQLFLAFAYEDIPPMCKICGRQIILENVFVVDLGERSHRSCRNRR